MDNLVKEGKYSPYNRHEKIIINFKKSMYKNPRFLVQDKVYDEIYSIFGDSDRPVEMEDLAKLTYMEQVLKETLRLFPVGPVFLRKVTEEIQIGKTLIARTKIRY
jgi:Cytochrome P450